MYGLVSRIQDNDETADVMFESVGIKRLAASAVFEHFASRGFEFSLLAKRRHGLVSRIQVNDETADVMFESAGIKRLSASVAKLTII